MALFTAPKGTLLITGGHGLVGKALQTLTLGFASESSTSVNPTSPPSQQVIYLSSPSQGGIDLTDTKKLVEVFEKYKPDQVIHLAALVGGLYKNMNDNLEMYRTNLIMNINMIEMCHKFNVQKSIFCLSTCIFPEMSQDKYPISETDLHKGPPHDSNKGYSYAKRMTQIHTELYNDYYINNNMPNRMICIIPTNIYGEHDNFNLQSGHVIPSLIHQCYLSALTGKEFVIKGTGKPLRQFIYSQDLARLLLWVLENFKGNSIILSPDEKDEYSISQISEYIKTSFENYYSLRPLRGYNTEIKLRFDSSFADGQYKKTANNGLLKSLIGNDLNLIQLKDGIDKTVKWFINNYEIARK